MVHRIYIVIASAWFTWVCGIHARAAPGGLVIYKQFSFDPDTSAEIAPYSTFEHYAVVDNVHTPSGQTLRILSGQDPVYVPEPGNPGSTPDQATRTILTAEKRFPQFAAKLETVREAWAAPPIAEAPVEPRPRATATPRPSPPTNSASVLRTKSGQVFAGWSISAFEGKTVVIKHSGGISRIPASDLPNDLIGLSGGKPLPVPEPVAQSANLPTADSTIPQKVKR
jgi:hypothetical protein